MPGGALLMLLKSCLQADQWQVGNLPHINKWQVGNLPRGSQ
jgi:hypothetical protein